MKESEITFFHFGLEYVDGIQVSNQVRNQNEIQYF